METNELLEKYKNIMAKKATPVANEKPAEVVNEKPAEVVAPKAPVANQTGHPVNRIWSYRLKEGYKPDIEKDDKSEEPEELREVKRQEAMSNLMRHPSDNTDFGHNDIKAILQDDPRLIKMLRKSGLGQKNPSQYFSNDMNDKDMIKFLSEEHEGRSALQDWLQGFESVDQLREFYDKDEKGDILSEYYDIKGR